MLLFPEEIDPLKNHLPYDGIVHYHGNILSTEEAKRYFEKLLKEIQWKNDEAIIYGKKIITKRKVAWYGDQPFSYTYSNITKTALAWNEDLKELKKLVEKISGEHYNSCLLNLYHSGEEGMTWHTDAEKDLKKEGAIASLSLGTTRKFAFKHIQSGQKVEFQLESGSLLVMKGTTQRHWLHSLPTTKKVIHPRINLTFRSIES